ncbi:uncharacterized protein LOC143469213 isoform X2 [Clavelina lepadiformis]|uniref:uncharacterized protein LOC143469213 isoform X2 n=1 Tax=Clavelina lepadiformis TaxID=159417 RepID=UPI004042DB8D
MLDMTVSLWMTLHLTLSFQMGVTFSHDKVTNTTSMTSYSCKAGEYRCWDGTCIPGPSFCDGTIDCPDRTDELDYESLIQQLFNVKVMRIIVPCVTPSSWRLYKSHARPCALHHNWICDGIKNQCIDDVDEECWRTPSGGCGPILSKLKCDGFQDCPSGQDEENCITCASSGEEGYRIDESKLCDGNFDCLGHGEYDLSDECVAGCRGECSLYCHQVYEICGNRSLCEVAEPDPCVACSDRKGLYRLSQLCDGNFDCIDQSDEINCSDFRCKNGNLVKEALRCDTKDDCGDTSDECDCYDSFTCTNSRCIFESSVCDGTNDCGDHSDECLTSCENSKRFICENGECISASAFCDGNIDCSDGSDEVVMSYLNTTTSSVPCNNAANDVNKTCILRQTTWLCDIIEHCVDREDECQPECAQLTFWCDGGKCLNVEAFCDGINDCQDGTDELPYFPQSGSDVIPCASKFAFSDVLCALEAVHPWVCDVFTHCANRTDECTAGCASSYTCRSGECIDRNWLCDGDYDCLDGSDEQLLEGDVFECVKTRHPITRTCLLPISMTTDNVSDCDRGMDLISGHHQMETGSHYDEVGPNFSQKRPNFFQCVGERHVIPGEFQCDGVFNCAFLSDECLCEVSPPICDNLCYHPLDGTKAQCDSCLIGQIKCDQQCIERKQVCDGVVDCSDGSDEQFCKHDVTCAVGEGRECISEYNCTSAELSRKRHAATPCDGKPQCMKFEDECGQECASGPGTLPGYCHRLTQFPGLGSFYGCKEGGIYLKGRQVCDGLSRDCLGGEDEADCPGRIYCNSTTASGAIHIHHSQRCDGKVDCSDRGDEEGCPSHYYCDGGEPFFVPMRAVMDGKVDCLDGSDECPEDSFNGSVFSSRELMIRDPVLRCLIWIMGAFSIAGNVAVLLETFYIMIAGRHRFKKKRPIAKVHHILVVNLAMADLLMGAYLLLLGAESLSRSGSYCQYDKHWRTSGTCSFLGILTVLSSVTSVLILLIMTSYRVYGVTNPFRCKNLSCIPAFCFAALAWITSFILALLPVTTFSYHYKSHAWIKHNSFFTNDVIDRKTMIKFIRKLPLFYGNDAKNTSLPKNIPANSWDSIKEIMTTVFGPNTVKGEFGYYSNVSVCMPKIYVTTDDVAWEHSMVIVVFNCLAIVYMLGAYIFILVKTKKSISKKRKNRQTSMFRKISYIVITDVACWLPISVMSFMNFAGFKIPENAYVVSAVVLLPINSALNPLLYSSTIQRLLIKVFTCGSRGGGRIFGGRARKSQTNGESYPLQLNWQRRTSDREVWRKMTGTRSTALDGCDHHDIPDVIPEQLAEGSPTTVEG